MLKIVNKFTTSSGFYKFCRNFRGVNDHNKYTENIFFSIRKLHSHQQITFQSNLVYLPIRELMLLMFLSRKRAIILGIETSCDDTGCAIVDSNGNILGENKYSQLQFHLRLADHIFVFPKCFHIYNYFYFFQNWWY